MIRSRTPCTNGFKVDFYNQCLTVYSCSNYHHQYQSSISRNSTISNNDNSKVQAAVALIDNSNYSIRFIRILDHLANHHHNKTAITQ